MRYNTQTNKASNVFFLRPNVLQFLRPRAGVSLAVHVNISELSAAKNVITVQLTPSAHGRATRSSSFSVYGLGGGSPLFVSKGFSLC
jgi:hypothetical protein